jgi:transposase
LVNGFDHAGLDAFRGHANPCFYDGLPHAAVVLDVFHVVRLGTQVSDKVRRRVK